MIEQYISDIEPKDGIIALTKEEADHLVNEIVLLKKMLKSLVLEIDKDYSIYLVNKKHRPKYLKAKKYLGL